MAYVRTCDFCAQKIGDKERENLFIDVYSSPTPIPSLLDSDYNTALQKRMDICPECWKKMRDFVADRTSTVTFTKPE